MRPAKIASKAVLILSQNLRKALHTTSEFDQDSRTYLKNAMAL